MFAGSIGRIAIVDPATRDAEHPVWLHYMGAGLGATVGVRKVPKIGKLLDPDDLLSKGTLNIAPQFFRNHGTILAMNGCVSNDLTLDDFKGSCCFVDVGIGVIVGYAGFGLLMNVDPSSLANLSIPAIGPTIFEATANPKALLLTRGWNLGPQVNAGISFSEGRVW